MRVAERAAAAMTEKLLRSGREVALRGGSGSMWPLIAPGDRVLARPGRPRRGDVVVFRLGDRLAMHRVVRVEPARVRTRGDASRREDPPLSPRDVLGVVARVTKPWGTIDLGSRPGRACERLLRFLGGLRRLAARAAARSRSA